MGKMLRPPSVLLTQRDVARLVSPRMVLRVVRGAFLAAARSQTVMPPKVYLPLPGGNDFRAMPAFLRHPPACGMKWVNVHARNPRRGWPSVMALIVINDPATGAPLGVMDGLLITKLRTAAAAAVAAQALARPESAIVGLIGCGAQADAQVLMLAQVLRRLRRVVVWGYHAGEAAAFCRAMRRRMPALAFEPEARIAACVQQADVLVTITPSHRPLVRRSWVRPGTHINAVGADGPGKQELDPRILRDAVVVVDDPGQAVHGGELNVPVRRGQYDASRIHASLGEVLTGRRPARRTARQITVFDSTGVAIHDVALGAELVRHARRRGIGRRIAWSA